MRLVGYCSRSIYCLTNIDNDSGYCNVASNESVNVVVRNGLFRSFLRCGITIVGKRKLGAGSGGDRGSIIKGLVVCPLR